MKIEGVKEHRERMLRENESHRVPGRTLPTNCQWNGIDQVDGGAAKRHLRQQQRLAEKRKQRGAGGIE